MDSIVAFLILAVVYYIGELVGTLSKAKIPSVFITACLFILGYWTFFPKNIVSLAGMGAPLGGTLVVMMTCVHVGTILSIKQLLEQWKIVIITLAGIVGMCILCWFIAVPIVGKDFVIAGLPPLTGGIVAASMMQTAAAEKGLMAASVLAIAMYCIQGFVGYPLTAICLKREGKKLLKKYHENKENIILTDTGEIDTNLGNMKVNITEKKRLIPAIPEKYTSSVLILMKVIFVAFIANRLSALTGGAIHQAVLALIVGIIATEIGFLDKNSLQKANAYGFLMYVLMMFIFDGLKSATPDMLKECIVPMAIIIVIGVIGMAILSIIVGKVLKVSYEMAFATSLTALYGFPPNLILTQEASKALAETPEEEQYLMDQMAPMMIVGGFVTVTITSVLIAGTFVNLL